MDDYNKLYLPGSGQETAHCLQCNADEEVDCDHDDCLLHVLLVRRVFLVSYMVNPCELGM